MTSSLARVNGFARVRKGMGSIGLATALLLAPVGASVALANDVVVFAAASLKNALDDIAGQWKTETGKTTVISYAASSALAKQIAEGAPADIFISADLACMDDVAGKNLIKPDTRSNLLGNRIVLVAPADSDVKLDVAAGMDLAGALKGGKLAMGDPKAVPAGKYGKAALQKLGVWDSVSGSVAAAENVRAALVLVSRGEAPLGIVYQTDAGADPGVKIVGMFPEDSHPPIIYPVAITASSENPDAAEFLKYLHSDKAAAAFAKQGFTVLKTGA
jgi:molybdate transport system substrate-binding protein